MIELTLSTEDLQSTRFAYSPLIELATSYRVLKDAALQPHVDRWEETAVRSLHGLEFPYLEALIPVCGYIPDFLTPTPTRTDLMIEDELQKLLHTPTSTIQASMQAMIEFIGDSEARRHYLTYPHEMIACLVEDLRLYWQRALEPYWSQLSSILEGDIMYRARQLATDGATKVYAELSPVLALTDNQLQIQRPGNCKHHFAQHDIAGRGMQLVPTVFINEKVWWQVTPEWQPMIIYGARGIGQWQQHTPPPNQSLELLMGAGRASVLLSLNIPGTTSDLAIRLQLTAGAVSQHLDRLAQTGLVESQRSGKRVYYYLSQRGVDLLKLFDAG